MNCPWCGTPNVWTPEKWGGHIVQHCAAFPSPKTPARERLTIAQVRDALLVAVRACDEQHYSEASVLRALLRDLGGFVAPAPEDHTQDMAPHSENEFITFAIDHDDGSMLGGFAGAPVTVEDVAGGTIPMGEHGPPPPDILAQAANNAGIDLSTPNMLDSLVDGFVRLGFIEDTPEARARARERVIQAGRHQGGGIAGGSVLG